MEYLNECDCTARIELEKQHPEEMAKINELRKERDRLTKESNDCQKKIDEIYLSISNFDNLVGKVIKLSPEDTGFVEKFGHRFRDYLLVKKVERMYNGARLYGTYISLYTWQGAESVEYNSNYDESFDFNEISELKFADKSEYDNLIVEMKSAMV